MKEHNPFTVKVESLSLTTLPRITDPRGNLTFVQSDHVPFPIRRVFWVYDVPGGDARGAHAHKELWQMLVALSGSFDVMVTDGHNWRTFTLKRPFEALLVPPGIWNTLVDFSSGAVCLALVSDEFSEADYIRDYDRYLEWKTTGIQES